MLNEFENISKYLLQFSYYIFINKQNNSTIWQIVLPFLTRLLVVVSVVEIIERQLKGKLNCMARPVARPAAGPASADFKFPQNVK